MADSSEHSVHSFVDAVWMSSESSYREVAGLPKVDLKTGKSTLERAFGDIEDS